MNKHIESHIDDEMLGAISLRFSDASIVTVYDASTLLLKK